MIRRLSAFACKLAAMKRPLILCVALAWIVACAAVFWRPSLASWDRTGLTFAVLAIGPWLFVVVLFAIEGAAMFVTYLRDQQRQTRGFPIQPIGGGPDLSCGRRCFGPRYWMRKLTHAVAHGRFALLNVA
jgi:hypothetical protein